MIETTYEELRAVLLREHWTDTGEEINDWRKFTYEGAYGDVQTIIIRKEPISRNRFHTGNWNMRLLPIGCAYCVNQGHRKLSDEPAVVIQGWTAKGLGRALRAATMQRYSFDFECQ